MTFKYFEINQKLLLIKVHYFFWYGGISTIQPNLSTYARQLGFSSVVVGFLFTAMPIMAIIFRPIFGMVADKFHRQKELFISSQILTLFSILAIFFIPSMEVRNPVANLVCTANQNAILKISVAGQVINNCTIDRYKYKFNNLLINYEKDNISNELTISLFTRDPIAVNNILFFPVKELQQQNRTISWCNQSKEDILYKLVDANGFFPYPTIGTEEIYSKYWCWLFFVSMVLIWIAFGSVSSLGDAICFELLEGKSEDYGKQRLFGALGWGIVSAISGIVTDILSDGKSVTNYSFCFIIAFIFILIDIVVCLKIEFTEPKSSKHFTSDVGRLFVKIRNNVFFLWCTCLGIGSALIWQFLYWLIEDQLLKENCDLQYYIKTLNGLIQFIETIFGEIPFFFISGWLLNKVGHTNVMSMVLICFAGRLALYSVISNPWWFLPVELLNGIDFGLCFSCMASYASKIAPEGTEATMQSLVGAIYEGVGTAVGSSVAGLVYNEYGGVQTFRYFSYFTLISGLIHILLQCLLKYEKKK